MPGYRVPGERSAAWRRSLPAGPWVLHAVILAVTLVVAVLMARLPLAAGIGLVAGLTVFIASFVNTNVGLCLVVLSMLLSPEIGAGALSGDSATTASRGVTVRAEDLLLVLLGFSWLAQMAVHKDLGLVRRTPLNRPIAGYVVVCLAATAIGVVTDRVNGATGFFYVLKYVEYFVVYFVVANYLEERTQIQRFLGLLLATALVVSLVAMAQIPSGERVSAPFEGERGEPNTLGGYLLLVGAVVGGLLLNAPRAWQRWALGGFLAILAVPFLATLSRGSYLAVPFIYLTLVALERRRRTTMLIAGVLLALAGAFALPSSVRERVLYTFEQRTQAARVEVGGVRLDTSTSARLTSWQEALEAAGDSPLWGLGVTGYGFLDAQYPRILVETGAIGMVAFLILIGAILRLCLRVFRRAREPLDRGLAMGAVAGLAGLLVHAVGANTFIIVRIMEPFWFVVGLVVTVDRLQAQAPGSA